MKLYSEVLMQYLIILAFFPSILFAASDVQKQIDYSEVHKVYQSMNCLDEKTEQKIDECGIHSLKLARDKMNYVFNVLFSESTRGPQSSSYKIKESQEDWSRYMKSSCALETIDSEGGSGYHSIINFCYETKINERISYLEWILSNR